MPGREAEMDRMYGRVPPPRARVPSESLKALSNTLIQKVDELAKRGGGILPVVYLPGQQTDVLLLLGLTHGKLLESNRPGPVELVFEDTEFTPRSAEGACVLLVHDYAAQGRVAAQVAVGRFAGAVVVGTGMPSDWAALGEHAADVAPPVVLEPEEGELGLPRHGGQDVPEEWRAIYRAILWASGWGAPLPYGVAVEMARGSNEKGEDAEERMEEALQASWAQDIVPLYPADGTAALLSWVSPEQARRRWSSAGLDLDPKSGELAAILKAAQNIADAHSAVGVLRLLEAVAHRPEPWRSVKPLLSAQEKPRTRLGWLRSLLQAQGEALRTLEAKTPPEDLSGWADMYAELGEMEKAVRVLEVENRPRYLQHLHAVLLGRWAQRDAALVESADEAFDTLAPDDAVGLQARGMYKASVGAMEDALADFRRAWDKADSDLQRHYVAVAAADALLDAGQVEEAQAWLDAAPARERSVHAQHVAARLAAFRGQWTEAADGFKAVLDLDPVNAHAWHSLGAMALRRGHWAAARRALDAAYDLGGDAPPILHALGELALERGQHALEAGESTVGQEALKRARKWFLAALDADPDNVQAQVSLAATLLAMARVMPQQGAARRQEACDWLDALLQRQPRNVHALHLRARMYREAGALDEAERLLRMLLAADALNRAARVELALVYQVQGDPASAERELQEAERVLAEEETLSALEQVRGWNAVAEAWRVLGQTEQARQAAERAAAIDAENAYTLRLQAALAAGPEAERWKRRADALKEQLPEDFPAVPEWMVTRSDEGRDR